MKLGWTSPSHAGLLAVSVVFGVLFFRTESSTATPFVNFALFRNSTYTGATISNFLLNGVAGMLLVSMMLVQLGGGLSAQEAGHADARLRHRDRRLHPRRRKAAAAVRRAQADDLGQPDRRRCRSRC